MQNQTVKQVVDALKSANNVMVTVKNGPSVDELTAAVGLTLMLNRLNKHATTVFSGSVPSTIEFLQPETAIEVNTNSLRDFIIALDKTKADKLRYKVEDNVVRIFITPYRASISEHDLEFSQGDFNVDVVVALGVVGKEDFDQAITAHGRILHDATVIGVTKQDATSKIGSINWRDNQASSVSEMVASIAEFLGSDVLDNQIATALMTGIVSETDRFRNEYTTPQVMSISSKLMAAGANQQLIAEKLEEPVPVDPIHSLGNADAIGTDGKVKDSDGLLEIGHDEDEVQNIHIDDHGNLGVHKDDKQSDKESKDESDEGNQDDNDNINTNENDNDDENNTEVADRKFVGSPFGKNEQDYQESSSLSGIPPVNSSNSGDSKDVGFVDHHTRKILDPISPKEDGLQQPSDVFLGGQPNSDKYDDHMQPEPTVINPAANNDFEEMPSGEAKGQDANSSSGFLVNQQENQEPEPSDALPPPPSFARLNSDLNKVQPVPAVQEPVQRPPAPVVDPSQQIVNMPIPANFNVNNVVSPSQALTQPQQQVAPQPSALPQPPQMPLQTPPPPQTPVEAPTSPPQPPVVPPQPPVQSDNPVKNITGVDSAGSLMDLEKSVHSSHLTGNIPGPDLVLDDYIGTSKPPEDLSLEQLETATVKEPEPETKEKEKPDKPSVKIEPTMPKDTQTSNSSESTAPAVPPPLMPQAPTAPQFYEADGSQSNPFLNPPSPK